MSKLFYFFSIFTFLHIQKTASLECTTLEHKEKHRNEILLTEIFCKDVPKTLIIDKIYFVEKPYPQDVLITDSFIPMISNYSSLLNMRHVRRLVLKGLGIEHIMPGAFRNMGNLEELDLSYNQIKEVSEDTFIGLDNLKTLRLDGNQLSDDLDNKRKYLPKLENLFLMENPITNAI